METWKQFEDYVYEVSDLGHVRRFGKLKPLKPIPNGGYVYVVLSKGRGTGGFWKAHFIHRLVASVFIPNPANLPQVNHIDGDKRNNTASNLEWVSARVNAIKAVEAGAIATGERRSTAKYTDAQIARIRELRAQPQEVIAYASSVNMPTSYALAVIAGRKRRHG